MTRLIVSCVTLSLALAGACANKPAATAGEVVQAPAAAAAAQPAQAAQTGMADQAAAAMPPGQAAVQTATGTVIETMDAATYTYVRVKTDAGDLWAATSQFKVAVGDKVVVPLEMPMENFHSNALKRDFPLIYFSSRIWREGEAAPAAGAMPAMVSGHAPMGAAPSAPVTDVTAPMTPPAGGTTIATVWANRKALAGKPATVRGKVMKFNGGILGRNWMHIQDGTGASKDGTNDLTITSADGAKVGDIITATGTVVVDKDFGSGYAYVVMLEDAKIVVK